MASMLIRSNIRLTINYDRLIARNIKVFYFSSVVNMFYSMPRKLNGMLLTVHKVKNKNKGECYIYCRLCKKFFALSIKEKIENTLFDRTSTILSNTITFDSSIQYLL